MRRTARGVAAPGLTVSSLSEAHSSPSLGFSCSAARASFAHAAACSRSILR